jgi:LmbE family N-acetylglucosaminyl deacetylase
MKKLLIVLSTMFSLMKTFSQTPATYSSADVFLQIKKLNVLGSILYIAAHPDDENTRLLAYFSKGKLYRTGYLSLTRGDGGQNLLGDEQGIELGLIRTQELLAARRIDGAEQFFSRAYDFGFCKTPEEALRTWGHDKILSDVVWMIRKFQPDIVITRFPPDARAGHGHHSASSILAHEAFIDAADSTKFPEQFKYGVKVWQAKRLLWNTYNFGSINTTDNNQIKMDIGGYNPLLGKGYGELAAESRSQHKSQGFGVPAQRGESTEYFQLTAGDGVKNDLMDGVDISWQRVAGADKIESGINDILSKYNFEHPENSEQSLVELYKAIKDLPDGYWKNKKLDELENIIVECAGIYAEATSDNQYAVQGDSMNVNFFVNKRNDGNISLKEISFPSFDSSVNNNLATNKNFHFSKIFPVAVDQPVSQPYWLVKPLAGGSFDVADQNLIGKTQNDPAYEATFVFSVDGEDFSVKRPLQYKYTDPVKGELYEPLCVVPAVTAHLNQSVYVLDGQPSKEVEAELIAQKNIAVADVHLNTTNEWKINGGKSEGAMLSGDIKSIKGEISSSEKSDKSELSLTVDKIADKNGAQYSEPLLDERRISYDHIPNIIYFKPVTATLEKIDITIKGATIGYIAGAGDKVPQALQQMGYDVKMLNEADITDEKLKQYNAIITGVRAYDVDAFLSSKHDVLMRYISNGGNLIVQYNRSELISNGTIKVGPYPFSITGTRVTNENAEVHILLPDNSVLNYPNKITQKDFEGWIQERSTYQASKLDSHYIAPIGMHDDNEPETNGSLIIAPYGKGNFVYTGLVFFRELPAGVSGAYRLMANLIALPQNK